MTRPSNRTPWKRTAILFSGHMLNDGYASFFAPLLPLLIKRLDLSLAMAGLLGTVRILISSLAQPGLGLLVDRMQRPLLVVVGPLLTICAMSLIGRVGTFEQLILLMLVSGLGTALFHPAAAALVASGGGNNRGLVMAFFSAGGTLGGALAPLLIVTVVGLFQQGNRLAKVSIATIPCGLRSPRVLPEMPPDSGNTNNEDLPTTLATSCVSCAPILRAEAASR